MLSRSSEAKGKRPMLRGEKKKRKIEKQVFPLKLYSNLHSAVWRNEPKLLGDVS